VFQATELYIQFVHEQGVTMGKIGTTKWK